MTLSLSNKGATLYYGKIQLGSPYKSYKVDFSLLRTNLFLSDRDFEVLQSKTCTITNSHFSFVDNKKLVHATAARDQLKVNGKEAKVDIAILGESTGVISDRVAGVFGLNWKKQPAGYPESSLEVLLEPYGQKVFSLFLTADPDEKGSWLAVGGEALQRASSLGSPQAPIRWAAVNHNSRWQVAMQGFGMMRSSSFRPNLCATSRKGCVAVFDSSEPTIRVPRAYYSNFIRSLVVGSGADCYYEGSASKLVCSQCTAEYWSPIGFRIDTVSDKDGRAERKVYQLQPSDYLVDIGDYRCRVLFSETLTETDDTFYLGTAFLKTHHTLYDVSSGNVGLVCLDGSDACVGGVGSFEAAQVTEYCILKTQHHGNICFQSLVVYSFFWGLLLVCIFLSAGILAHAGVVISLRCYRRYRTRKTQRVQCAPMPETLGQRLLDEHDADVDDGEQGEGDGIALT